MAAGKARRLPRPSVLRRPFVTINRLEMRTKSCFQQIERHGKAEQHTSSRMGNVARHAPEFPGRPRRSQPFRHEGGMIVTSRKGKTSRPTGCAEECPRRLVPEPLANSSVPENKRYTQETGAQETNWQPRWPRRGTSKRISGDRVLMKGIPQGSSRFVLEPLLVNGEKKDDTIEARMTVVVEDPASRGGPGIRRKMPDEHGFSMWRFTKACSLS